MDLQETNRIDTIFKIIVVALIVFFSIPPALCAENEDINQLIKDLKYHNNHYSRERAARRLGRIKDPRAVEPLIESLKDKNSKVRANVAEALGKLKDPRAVEPLIEGLKLTNDIFYENAAVKALANIDKPAMEQLIKALKDKTNNWTVRNASAKAIGIIGDPKGVELLIGMLKEEKILGCVEGLARTKNPLAVEPLIEELNYQNSSYFREKVAKALGWIADPRAVESLIKSLKDKNYEVRERAAEALGRIKDPRAVKPLIKTLKTRDPRVSFDPVTGKPKQGDSQLRSWAGWALSEIGKPSVKQLIGVLKKGDAFARKRAAEALGDIGDPVAIDPLINALKDKDDWVRYWAISALSTIGKPAIEPLFKVLKDRRNLLRKRAAKALSRIDGPQVVNTLNKAFEENEFPVIAGAHEYYIRRGEPGSEIKLVKALKLYGDTRMANNYLNCGNKELEEVAIKWANDHRYPITKTRVRKEGPTWDSER